ncbi:MAG: VanZ family protein [Phycisphaeraceae bacterium]
MTRSAEDNDAPSASVAPSAFAPLPDPEDSDAAIGSGRFEKWLRRFARPLLAVYWPLLFISTHTKMPGAIDRAMDQVKHWNPDKFMHFGTYGPLTLLVVLAAPLGRKAAFMANLGFACVLVAIYSIVDELTQPLVGRTASAADIMADLWAAAVVFLALMWSHPSRRSTPTRLLASRTAVALLIPLAGIALFQKGFGLALWRLLPSWGPWIRGDVLDHFVCAIALFWLLMTAAPFGESRTKANLTVVSLVILALGPLIEWLQTLLSERGAELEDVIANTVGVVVALGIWLIVAGYRRGNTLET